MVSMTPKLSDEIRQAIHDQHGKPVKVVDAATNAIYFVVSAQQYQAVNALLGDDEFNIAETYAAQDQAAVHAWNHPGDAEYDRYDEHVAKP